MITSSQLAHEAIIGPDTFEQVQRILAGLRTPLPGKPHPMRHTYILEGLVHCGACGRRMQGQYNRDAAYYRCRYPQAYALTNTIEHPETRLPARRLDHRPARHRKGVILGTSDDPIDPSLRQTRDGSSGDRLSARSGTPRLLTSSRRRQRDTCETLFGDDWRQLTPTTPVYLSVTAGTIRDRAPRLPPTGEGSR